MSAQLPAPVETSSAPAVEEGISLAQDPDQVLEQASRAARALVRAVSQNEAQYVVRIGPSRHLRFEAWQTLAAFFGLSVSCEWTREIRDAEGRPPGWEARAVVRRGERIISAAEAQCTVEEPSWRGKPAFQLRSMAQTRAAVKALRQALAWVVVLAGYQPTPAEEVEAAVDSPPAAAEAPQGPRQGDDKATDAQRRAIWARWKELAKEAGIQDDMIRLLVKARYGVEHSRELTRAQASELLDWLRAATADEVAEAVGKSVDNVLDAEQVSP
jgi:hypothetical protein